MTDEIYKIIHGLRTHEVVKKGIKDGFYWAIVSLGTHPCAYIGLPKGHPFYGEIDFDKIFVDCHGGITFLNNDLFYNPVEIDVWWIGWDYAHFDDYIKYDSIEMGDKKWTVEEIEQEIMNVIEQLK